MALWDDFKPLYRQNKETINNLIDIYGHTKIFRELSKEYKMFVREKSLNTRFSEHIDFLVKEFDFSKIDSYIKDFLTSETFKNNVSIIKRKNSSKHIEKTFFIKDNLSFRITYSHNKILSVKSSNINFEIILHTQNEFISKPKKKRYIIHYKRRKPNDIGITAYPNISDQIIISASFTLNKKSKIKRTSLFYDNKYVFTRDSIKDKFVIEGDYEFSKKTTNSAEDRIKVPFKKYFEQINTNNFHYFYWNYFKIFNSAVFSKLNQSDNDDLVLSLFLNEDKIEKTGIYINSLDDIDLLKLQYDIHLTQITKDFV